MLRGLSFSRSGASVRGWAPIQHVLTVEKHGKKTIEADFNPARHVIPNRPIELTVLLLRNDVAAPFLRHLCPPIWAVIVAKATPPYSEANRLDAVSRPTKMRRSMPRCSFVLVSER